MNKNLGKQVRSGFGWDLIGTFFKQISVLTVSVVLARLLLPSDYGILALTTIVIAFSEILIDGGLMMVLIQRSSNSNKEYSTVFWSRLFSAIVLFVLIFFTSTYIAQFYETPILKQVLQVISFVLVLNSLSSVHKVKLTNNLDFKGQAKIVLVSTLLGGITGISLALLDYGVWALVFQTMTIHIIQAVLFWFYTKWIPSATYSVSFMTVSYTHLTLPTICSV